MGVLRRLAQSISRLRRVLHARAMPDRRRNATVGLPQGISLAAAGARTAAREPADLVRYPLDLDIGEVADGYHLNVRGICLTDENLLFECAFVPELTEEAEVWPNMAYGADVSPAGWNQGWSEGEVYERPAPEARYVWFDFFRPDYMWMEHLDRRGQPDSDYLRNRIARLTFDLKAGEAQAGK